MDEDEFAARVHGIYMSDSESDDSDFLSEELLNALRPPPIPLHLRQEDIVEVAAFKTVCYNKPKIKLPDIGTNKSINNNSSIKKSKQSESKKNTNFKKDSDVAILPQRNVKYQSHPVNNENSYAEMVKLKMNDTSEFQMIDCKNPEEKWSTRKKKQKNQNIASIKLEKKEVFSEEIVILPCTSKSNDYISKVPPNKMGTVDGHKNVLLKDRKKQIAKNKKAVHISNNNVIEEMTIVPSLEKMHTLDNQINKDLVTKKAKKHKKKRTSLSRDGSSSSNSPKKNTKEDEKIATAQKGKERKKKIRGDVASEAGTSASVSSTSKQYVEASADSGNQEIGIIKKKKKKKSLHSALNISNIQVEDNNNNNKFCFVSDSSAKSTHLQEKKILSDLRKKQQEKGA